MCIRAHVSFVLADVPGPTPAARADRLSQLITSIYHSIQKKKKKGEGLYADLCLI